MIVGSGNHYLLQVKGNQPSLQRCMQDVLLEQPLDTYQECEKDHGRHSSWTVSVYDASKNEKAVEWPHLNRLIHVHKRVLNTKTGAIKHSDRLYISDLHAGHAGYFAKIVRGHWAIENKLHHVKDVRHGEDDNQISEKNAAVNISTLSSIALNVHRMNHRNKIKKAQMYTAANIGNIICELRT